ncbi:MAG: hypothetical protein JST38_09895, partial [Bacteroidetes bacterium]|nr:hypothetical protein [Bacteroidota bacterium]
LDGGVCYTYDLTVTVTAPVFADDLEPNNSFGDADANPLLAAATTTQGHVNFLYDNSENGDYYRLQTGDDGELNVTIGAESAGAGSVRVFLFNNVGSTVNYFDAPVGTAGTPVSTSQSTSCNAQGTYYLFVQSTSPCGVSYQLGYTLTPPVFANDTEPNNSFNDANLNPVLAPNTFTEGHIFFSNYGDNYDYYHIQTPAEGTLTITTIAERVPAAAGNLRIYVYNSGGGQVDYYDASVGGGGDDDTTIMNFDCYGQGDYYLLAASTNGCGISYKLKYTVTGAVYANDAEPNNGFGDANLNPVLAPNTFAEGHINFNHYGDNNDYYRIQTPAEGTLRITTIAERVPAAAGNLRIYVYNSGGGQIDYYDASVGGGGDDDTTIMNFDCYGQGDYYLLAQSTNGCGISYKLKFETLPAIFGSDLEPNNTTGDADANPLLVPAMFSDGHINFAHYGDNTDYYRLHATASGVLRLTTIAERVPAAAGTLRVYVYNMGGGQIGYYDASVGGSSDDDTTSMDFDCYAPGDYYLLLQSVAGCGISYRLKYELLAATFANDTEPNNGFGQATVLNPDSATATGNLNFSFYGDNTDYYRLALPAAGNISFTLDAENTAGGTLRVYLYNGGGGQLAYQDLPVGAGHVPITTPVAFNGLSAGTYYLLLQSVSTCGMSYRMNCNDADNDGTCNYFDLCAGTPNGEGVNTNGCSCSQVTVDDGDPCTLDECLNGDVTHTFQDADGDLTCDANDGCPNDPNKTSAGACGCGNPDVPATWYADSDGDGLGDPNNSVAGYTCIQPPGYVADNTDGCPSVTGTVGSACDDGNPNTTGDAINASCNCVGTPMGCDDGDPCTVDSWDGFQCVHTFQDADGDGTCDANDGCVNDPDKTAPGACGCGVADVATTWYADTDGDGLGDPNNSQAGYTCIQPPGYVADNTDLCDGDANKTAPGACGCGVADVATTWYADTDGDGLGDPNNSVAGYTCIQPPGYVADNTDLCPSVSGTVGNACDDGNPNTTGDAIDASCTCVGTPNGGPCTGDQVVVNITTDGNPTDLSWQIHDGGNALVASGAPTVANSLNSETACLNNAPASACYTFNLYDSFGDGITGGGWELRTTGGKLLLRDDFSAGSSSPTLPTASPSYGSGHSFCLPEGPANIAATECGIFNNLQGNKVYCNKVTGATQYQFEFSDPDAGFIRRIVRTTNYVQFWDMVSNPLVPGVHYFGRVRTNVAGPVASAHWGSGCEMGLAATVPCSGLIPAPNYGHSCNETRAFNPVTNNSFIYATPVVGASQYQFRIFNASEGYDETFIRSTYILQLKWNTSVAPPLVNGSTYNVELNVRVGDTYSGFCASSCTITIDNMGTLLGGELEQT